MQNPLQTVEAHWFFLPPSLRGRGANTPWVLVEAPPNTFPKRLGVGPFILSVSHPASLSSALQRESSGWWTWILSNQALQPLSSSQTLLSMVFTFPLAHLVILPSFHMQIQHLVQLDCEFYPAWGHHPLGLNFTLLSYSLIVSFTIGIHVQTPQRKHSSI